MTLKQHVRILFRAARIYCCGTYHKGVLRHATSWRDAYTAALCEDVANIMSKQT
jgi:hypothetical protein